MFVQASTGAATRADVVFRYLDGRLQLMTTDGATSNLFRVGGLSNRGAWSCRTERFPIVQWSGSSADGGVAFSGEQLSYRFAGDTMVLAERVPLSGGQDGVEPEFTPECGSIDLALQ